MRKMLTTITSTCGRTAVRAAMAAQLVVLAAGAASAQELFNNTNTGGVGNQPSRATVFALRTSSRISEVQTYHWNYGRGAQPGSISLRASNGRVYGPFVARATSGYQNAPNVNWIAQVNLTLPADTYMVIDSDPGTWSQNPQSGGQGFAIVRGTTVNLRGPITINPGLPQPTPPPTQSCTVSPVFIRGLRYDDYSPYAQLQSTSVSLGGFIQISTRCLSFDGQVVVTLQDTARGNGFGVTAFRLTNVRVQGSTVIAQVPNLALFRNRSFHVAVFVFGNPWKTANPGTVTIQ